MVSFYLSREEMKSECYMTETPSFCLNSGLIQDEIDLRYVKKVFALQPCQPE